MTDEDRQKLCNSLRSPNWFCGPETEKAEQAADEIERLAELAIDWERAANIWHMLANRLQEDLRNGTRTVDFGMLGETDIKIDYVTPQMFGAVSSGMVATDSTTGNLLS